MARPRRPANLRAARQKAGLHQADIAQHLGITQAAVSQWETGATVPSGMARRLLAGLLDLPVAAIDGWFPR